MIDLNQLSDYVVEQRASDIHFAPGLPPIIRVDGEIKLVRVDKVSSQDILQMLYSILDKSEQEKFAHDKEIDCAIEMPSKVRYRINAFHTLNGTAAAFRLVPIKIPPLKEIALLPILETFTLLSKGLVLITGPTGSGKSTTLAAMIEDINLTQKKHIVTIEDPIEFIYNTKQSLINQRAVGIHTNSFANALRSTLREDPDVILVGEIRDLETMRLALTAAETGHLVFGTLHTSSATQTINRIIDIFPGETQPMIRSMLASSLEGIISQRLLKRANGIGRVAAFEIMVATNAIRNLIREDKIPQITSLIQLGAKEGMTLMSDYVRTLITQGIVKHEDVLEYLQTSEEFIKGRTQQHRAPSSTGLSDDEF